MSQTHSLVQGSAEWLAFRAKHFGASEAAAMLGISSYMKRDELLRLKTTGVPVEVTPETQCRFDEGHRLEAAARFIAEGIVNEELFSPTMSMTVDGLSLSASFDGLTMDETTAWECKTLNEKLRNSLTDGVIPDEYHPQLEQQLLISGAERCLFMAYDGTEELHAWYQSDPALRKRLLAGWKQFADDLKKYQPPEIIVDPVAHTVEALPALSVQIDGAVKASNLAEYKSSALAFIRAINTDLQTDQDFADADNVVKFCGRTEKELEAVKQQALAQTADIDALFRTIDTLKAEMRTKRLELNKLVTSKKQQMRESIVMEARTAWRAHIEHLNQRLESVHLPEITENFSGVIKGKRTMASLRDAVNTELARVKIEANEAADHIEANMKALKAMAGDYGFLFRDIQQIVTKDQEDLINLAKARIDEHKQAEAERLEAERERIRQEEAARAERERIEHQRKADAAKQAAATRNAEESTNQKPPVASGDAIPSAQHKRAPDSPQQPETSRFDVQHIREQLRQIDAGLDGYTCNELCQALMQLVNSIKETEPCK